MQLLFFKACHAVALFVKRVVDCGGDFFIAEQVARAAVAGPTAASVVVETGQRQVARGATFQLAHQPAWVTVGRYYHVYMIGAHLGRKQMPTAFSSQLHDRVANDITFVGGNTYDVGTSNLVFRKPRIATQFCCLCCCAVSGLGFAWAN